MSFYLLQTSSSVPFLWRLAGYLPECPGIGETDLHMPYYHTYEALAAPQGLAHKLVPKQHDGHEQGILTTKIHHSRRFLLLTTTSSHLCFLPLPKIYFPYLHYITAGIYCQMAGRLYLINLHFFSTPYILYAIGSSGIATKLSLGSSHTLPFPENPQKHTGCPSSLNTTSVKQLDILHQ